MEFEKYIYEENIPEKIYYYHFYSLPSCYFGLQHHRRLKSQWSDSDSDNSNNNAAIVNCNDNPVSGSNYYADRNRDPNGLWRSAGNVHFIDR